MAQLSKTTFDDPDEARLHCPEGHYVEWLYDSYAILPYTHIRRPARP
jgi:hypothetical protein